MGIENKLCHYLDNTLRQFSKMGLAWQLGAMKHILMFLGSRALNEIQFDDLQRVTEILRAMPLKTVTTHNRLSVLRTVLRWCAEKGFMKTVRFPKIPMGQYEKFIPPTPEELRDILAVADPHISA